MKNRLIHIFFLSLIFIITVYSYSEGQKKIENEHSPIISEVMNELNQSLNKYTIVREDYNKNIFDRELKSYQGYEMLDFIISHQDIKKISKIYFRQVQKRVPTSHKIFLNYISSFFLKDEVWCVVFSSYISKSKIILFINKNNGALLSYLF